MKTIDIPGTNGRYKIREDGTVFGPRATLKPCLREGYLMVRPFINGRYRSCNIHRLLMISFKPVSGMEDLTVDHIDGDKKNNSLANLRWLTREENSHECVALGNHTRGERHGCSKLREDDVRFIRKHYRKGNNWSNAKELARKFGVSTGTIVKAANGSRWSHISIGKDGA